MGNLQREQMVRLRQLCMIGIIAMLPALFFTGGPEHDTTRSIKHAWNLGHIIYFALLPVIYFSCRKDKHQSSKHQLYLPLLLALVVGTSIELLQFKFGRTFDVRDLIRNMIGGSAAIAFILPIRKTLPKTIKIIVAAFVLTQLVPVSMALIDEHIARRNFPILSDFQNPLQIDRWDGNAKRRIQKFGDESNNHALHVMLSSDTYSGVNMVYFPGNWQSYSHFQFRIYNPDTEPISITCRIHDEQHVQGRQYYEDRYNKSFSISQGWNTISINLNDVRYAPRNRQMDLRRIHGIGFFATKLPSTREIYIDDLKLL